MTKVSSYGNGASPLTFYFPARTCPDRLLPVPLLAPRTSGQFGAQAVEFGFRLQSPSGFFVGRRLGRRPGFRPRRQSQSRLRVYQAQLLAVGLQDEVELPAPQSAVLQAHRPVLSAHKAVALERRGQVVPIRVK